MAGRTQSLAVESFLEPLRRAVSRFTKTVIRVSPGYHATGNPHALWLGTGDPVAIGRDRRFQISLSQQYAIIRFEGRRGPWKIQTLAYNYTLYESDKALLGYHWHPSDRVPYPHAHVYVSELPKHHLPTGRISVEQVLWMTATDFAVEPLSRDWQAVLAESLAAFQAWRTWQ